jgi:hypothetical protein
MAENRCPEGVGLENNNHYHNNNTLNDHNYTSNSLTLPLDQYASTPSTVVSRAMGRHIDFTALKGAQRTPKTAKGARKLSAMPMRPLNAVDNSPSVDSPGLAGGEAGRSREREATLAVEVDMQRMQLISPPPEEVISMRRHSVSSKFSFASRILFVLYTSFISFISLNFVTLPMFHPKSEKSHAYFTFFLLRG